MREKNNPRVLIADDEHIIADSLVMILSRSGFDARAAYSGEMVIELASKFRPEMLVTDVIMAGITGIEAAIIVHEMLPSCKILLFSGQAATTDLLEIARAQNYDFELLVKPIHPTDLISRLRSSVCV